MMKKLTMCVMAVALSLIAFPTQLKAGTEPTSTPVAASNTVDQAFANTLITRLSEIKTMDKSNLSSVEKRQLRKETRSIKSNLKKISGGVYLSGGALLIILVILILLL